MSKFDADKISLNKDDVGFIRNEVEIIISPITNDVNDLKGNVGDVIIKAVEKGFRIHDEKYCNEHLKQTAKNTKKLRLHDWWLWGLSLAVVIIFAIIILA